MTTAPITGSHLLYPRFEPENAKRSTPGIHDQYSAGNRGGPAGRNIRLQHRVAGGITLGSGNIPQLAFSGGFVSGSAAVTNLGGGIDQPNRSAINTFQVVENVSHTTARHVFKLGADIRYTQLNRLYDLAFSGQVSFSGTLNAATRRCPENPQNIPMRWLILPRDSPVALCSLSATLIATSARQVLVSLGRTLSKLRKNLTLNYGFAVRAEYRATRSPRPTEHFPAAKFHNLPRSERPQHPE